MGKRRSQDPEAGESKKARNDVDNTNVEDATAKDATVPTKRNGGSAKQAVGDHSASTEDNAPMQKKMKKGSLLTTSRFDTLDLSENTKRAIDSMGFENMTLVQEQWYVTRGERFYLPSLLPLLPPSPFF
jgi:hypothetical protein